MRYSDLENTVLVGQFKPNQTVTIKLIELSTDTLVSVSNNSCSESQHMPGMYLWDTSKITSTTLPEYANLLYEMTAVETGIKFYGKFIFGGYVTELRRTTHIINARI